MDQPQIMMANGTIPVSSIVKLDTSDNNSVLVCGANGRAIGVSQHGSRTAPIPDVTASPAEAAQVGESLQVYTVGMTCLLRAGGTITPGAYIKSDSSGDGVVCAETAGLKENYVGISLEAAADGELFKVIVQPGTVTTET